MGHHDGLPLETWGRAVIPLSNAANKAKTKWNSAHYEQIKVSVGKDVAASFKSACAAAGVSMASVLSQFMAEYADTQANQKTSKKTETLDFVSTKKKRSNTVSGLIGKLELVRDAEERAMENTPENFRGTGSFEASEERIPLMEEALDILERLY